MTISTLFLCTGNSARSIMAEGILRDWGEGRFTAYSAGSQPKSQPHPMALEVLRAHGINNSFAASKSWNDFAGAGAPKLDLIFTVCDSAANEACPNWPSHPMTAHWGVPDPAAVSGDEERVREAFELGFRRLSSRIQQLLDLPVETMEKSELKAKLFRIGSVQD